MTEEEWLATPDYGEMLRYLGKKASGRKLRLFAVACVRRIGGLLTDERCRRAADSAERYADRQVERRELRADQGEAGAAARAIYAATGDANAALAAVAAGTHTAFSAAYGAASYAGSALREKRPQERAAQADLLRCVFGNPFRPFRPATVSSAWQTPQVVALAQAAYEQRDLPAGTLDLARLAVLADALEEAGCDQADLLGHLRGPGPHVRGCWAVDLLLGKQ